MKIYLIRHEERVNDASFFAPLTKTGLINSSLLVEDLENLDITKIYSSPTIRCMQTIYPYSKKMFIPINLDYSLLESKSENNFTSYSKNVTLPLYIAETFNYNPDYISLIRTTNINYPETKEEMYKRVTKFLEHIIKIYSNTKENIIFVTHRLLSESIMNFLNEKSDIKPDYKSMTNYKMGQLTLIYDNKLTFKKINDK